MCYYRVTVVYDNGDMLTYDTRAENALCAVYLAGKNMGIPVSVTVQEL